MSVSIAQRIMPFELDTPIPLLHACALEATSWSSPSRLSHLRLNRGHTRHPSSVPARLAAVLKGASRKALVDAHRWCQRARTLAGLGLLWCTRAPAPLPLPPRRAPRTEAAPATLLSLEVVPVSTYKPPATRSSVGSPRPPAHA
jgi:hypothetical protein